MLINLKHVSKIKKGNHILNHVDWQINKGEKWVLYGLNGAGKTTLLNIINAYDFATDGDVTLFNMRPGQQGYSAEKVRNHIGFVSGSLLDKFQDGEVVIDVVISGLFKSIGVFKTVTEEYIELARQQLDKVGMLEFENQYLGYLSTGEKQKVLIARALMGQPQLLILDEPASGLDFISREEFLKSLNKLSQLESELAIIYVTHFIEEVIPLFKKILLLKNGQKHQSGDIEDILDNIIMSSFFERDILVSKQYNRYQLFLKE